MKYDSPQPPRRKMLGCMQNVILHHLQIKKLPCEFGLGKEQEEARTKWLK